MLSAPDFRENAVLLDSFIKSSEEAIEGFTFGEPYIGQTRIPPFGTWLFYQYYRVPD